MPYNNYIPQFYQPQYSLNQPVNQQSNLQNYSGINWVQGENAAKSYPVASGQSALLMDSENPVMYIKSTDQSGMPLPLRIFDYVERTSGSKEIKSDNGSYVTREEFDSFRNEIKSELRKSRIVRTPSKETEKGN